ncbi:unnamed protein product [Mucor hiemalis]
MPNQTSSIATPSTAKRFTRDEIMAMARYEYARQLCLYTKAQLKRGSKQTSSSSNVNTGSVKNASPAATLIC